MRTALHYTDRSRNAEKFLIAGVDEDAVDKFSQTALQRATSLCFEGVVVATRSFEKKSRIWQVGLPIHFDDKSVLVERVYA